ncbi:uncharacterized protein LOC129602390 [Paramacrobiotus metropolitanus]|uniref:uncharacterized protein LOC129602390 n=1 Tax=Paramacrobiotus metropolitanus TaxID=2943436 RepID=UPI0024460A5D|nr:uncharacterized protein LOC129602390 [Paramacrobiotus metropolitanus]XP_055357368.1 uncharacterized protein LOC129602390 [Paramacrobiotus metropolitanus]
MAVILYLTGRYSVAVATIAAASNDAAIGFSFDHPILSMETGPMDSNATRPHNVSFLVPSIHTTRSYTSPSTTLFGHSLSISLMSTGILAFTFNGLALLFTLTIHKPLRTPFNMYVVALMCTNVVFVCVDRTLLAVADTYGTLWLGKSLCTLRLYSLYIFAPFIYHHHLLITVNRAWALFGPISYRNRHNRTVAVMMCGAVLAYVHIVMLVPLIRDHLYFRQPLERGCYLNTARQFAYTQFTSIWMFDVPCAASPVAYPLLLWKMLSLRRTRPVNTNAVQRRAEGKKEAFHRPFRLLTLYTCSTLVCWVPSMCYYRILSNFPTQSVWVPTCILSCQLCTMCSLSWIRFSSA